MVTRNVATPAVIAAIVMCCADAAEAAPRHLKQMSPMRQESLKVTPLAEPTRPMPAASTQPDGPVAPVADMTDAVAHTGFTYDASGRRDPFAPIVQPTEGGQLDANLPPLQRVSLTELNLIAIVWGSYGYTAMVQTPDGKGYTVRRGTKVGPNNGVVSTITERGIIVQERFTDVYGNKQEREYVKLLHPKEGSE